MGYALKDTADSLAVQCKHTIAKACGFETKALLIWMKEMQ